MKNLLIPILLAGLALTPALATADPHGLEWRGGNGRDIWYRHHGEQQWRRAPGSAREVGDGWVIGTDRRNGGYSIYRWDGRTWHRMPGSGVRIGGDYYNTWVINDRGERFTWTGAAWRQEPNFGRRGDHGRDDNDWNGARRDHDRDHGHDNNHDNNRGRDDNDWNRGRDRDRDHDGRDFGRNDRFDQRRNSESRSLLWNRGNR